MKDLLGMFTTGEELVRDFCEGTCPTAKICMLLDKLRKLAGCDVNTRLLSAAEQDLLYSAAFPCW